MPRPLTRTHMAAADSFFSNYIKGRTLLLLIIIINYTRHIMIRLVLQKYYYYFVSQTRSPCPRSVSFTVYSPGPVPPVMMRGRDKRRKKKKKN